MIREAQEIRNPLWARYDQDGPPNWSAALAGVLYQGMTHESAFHYLADAKIHTAFCAVGRRLWPDRLGPWLSYSVNRLDRTRDVLVRERPWPWCLGDEIVFVVHGKAGLSMVDVELDDEDQARMYTEVGLTDAARSPDLFVAKVEQWVGSVIGPMARQVHERLLPPPGWRPPQARRQSLGSTMGRPLGRSSI